MQTARYGEGKAVRLIICTLILLLGGCSSFGGSKGVPYSGLSDFKEGTGQVYIYRPSHFVMSLAIPTLKIDEKPAPPIRNGSYMVYNLEPGIHKFVLKKNGNWAISKIEFDVDVNKSQRKYFRLSTDFGGFDAFGPIVVATINGYFGQVSEEQAIGELQNLLHTADWP